MKSAIMVLSKQNSFLQGASTDNLGEVAVALDSALKKGAGDMLSPSQRRLARAFVESPEGSAAFLQQPASAGSYAPQSGAIFGILKNMKESFEAALADAQ